MTQPLAYLIRETKRGKSRIVFGKAYMAKSSADWAAQNMTNRWRVCVVVPVFERPPA